MEVALESMRALEGLTTGTPMTRTWATLVGPQESTPLVTVTLTVEPAVSVAFKVQAIALAFTLVMEQFRFGGSTI